MNTRTIRRNVASSPPKQRAHRAGELKGRGSAGQDRVIQGAEPKCKGMGVGGLCLLLVACVVLLDPGGVRVGIV